MRVVSRRKTALLKIVEINLNIGFASGNEDHGIAKGGRAGADDGVLGKAKAFAGNPNQIPVDGAIAIGIVENGDRVAAGLYVVEGDGGRITGRNALVLDGPIPIGWESLAAGK